MLLGSLLVAQQVECEGNHVGGVVRNSRIHVSQKLLKMTHAAFLTFRHGRTYGSKPQWKLKYQRTWLGCRNIRSTCIVVDQDVLEARLSIPNNQTIQGVLTRRPMCDAGGVQAINATYAARSIRHDSTCRIRTVGV